MTIKEAFEITVNELEWKEVQRDMTLKGSDDTYNEGIQYLKICAMAIEKQIPKEPIWTPHDDENDWYNCPTCGKLLPNKKEHHCVCGQALYWEEHE